MAMLLVFILGGCSTQSSRPVAETADRLPELIEVMGQRLRLMPGVAKWKLAHDKAVRDRARERLVLDNAVAAVEQAAREVGRAPFPEQAVRQFYQAQIDAAVAIQLSIFEEAPDRTQSAPDLMTEIRPQLDRLGASIARLLMSQSTTVDRDEVRRLAHRIWRVDGLEPSDVDTLVDALLRLLAANRSRF